MEVPELGAVTGAERVEVAVPGLDEGDLGELSSFAGNIEHRHRGRRGHDRASGKRPLDAEPADVGGVDRRLRRVEEESPGSTGVGPPFGRRDRRSRSEAYEDHRRRREEAPHGTDRTYPAFAAFAAAAAWRIAGVSGIPGTERCSAKAASKFFAISAAVRPPSLKSAAIGFGVWKSVKA